MSSLFHYQPRIIASVLTSILISSILIGGGVLGCATQTRSYSPADAARAKVAFLRREGGQLNPLQRSLIRQLPYRRDRRLQTQMQFVRDRGAVDPGHVTGFKRRSLSETLAKRKHLVLTSEESQTDLGEESSVDPKR